MSTAMEPTVDTSVFAKCARLVEDSTAAAVHWNTLRKQVEETQAALGKGSDLPVGGGAAKGGGSAAEYAEKIEKLEHLNEELEEKLREVEASLAKKEREMEQAERDMAKKRANIIQDSEKLKEYNRNLDRAKQALEKRENEIRKREAEMRDTMDFFSNQLAPTEQKARPARTPVFAAIREPSCVPLPDTVKRCKKSRTRASMQPSPGSDAPPRDAASDSGSSSSSPPKPKKKKTGNRK